MADGSLNDTPRPPEVKDRTRELLEKLEEAGKVLKQSDPKLAASIEALVAASTRPGQTEDPIFRTRMAYIVQDAEKHYGPLAMGSGMRDEMTRMAATYPGLQNERIGDLLKTTPAIDNRDLVREIRTLASDTAKAAGNQTSATVESRVDALENRARLERAPEPNAPVRDGPPSSPITRDHLDRVQPSPGGGSEQNERVRPRDGGQVRPPGGPNDQVPSQNNLPGKQEFVRQPSGLSKILSAMRPDGEQASPWDKPPTPMTERHGSFRQSMQNDRDEKVFKAAEVAGTAAVEAMRAFANGPGGSIMARINDAAKSEPRGLEGVFAEMREGGKYDNLRKQLQGERAFSNGFAESYDKAVDAVGAYGRQREAADATGQRRSQAETALGGAVNWLRSAPSEVGQQLGQLRDAISNAGTQRRGPADAVNDRFEKLDAEVGRSASALPGSKDGKSMIEDLGEKVRALVTKAVDAVKAAFSPTARQEASASPSASL